MSTTYRVGDHLIGVRSTDPDVDARLRSVLDAHVVSDVEAPPNLSLKVGTDTGQVRELHFLYRGASAVVRTDSRGRLVRAVLAQLDGYLDPRAGVTRLNARVLVRGREVVLVDAALGGVVDRIERRLNRFGYQMADAYGVAVDRDSLEAVLWPPRLDVDAEALATVDRHHPPSPRELPLTDARLAIRQVIALGPALDYDDGDESPARRLMRLAALGADRDRRVEARDLDVIRRLDEMGRVTVATDVDDRVLFELLREP